MHLSVGGCREVLWRLSALLEIKVRRELNADKVVPKDQNVLYKKKVL